MVFAISSPEFADNGPIPRKYTAQGFHRLYALDVVLPDLEHPTKVRLLNAMKGHVLAQAQLIGT
jgi:phosphatidylethanolamine-binding protein (PEBP) family uncharacterized protein